MRRSRRFKINQLLCGVWLLLINSITLAHDARPMLVSIVETQKNSYLIEQRAPNLPGIKTLPVLVAPNQCQWQKTFNSNQQRTAEHIVRWQTLQCQQSLEGKTVKVSLPDGLPVLFTLFQYQSLTQPKIAQLKSPNTVQWQVPKNAQSVKVLMDYLSAGIYHILRGFDHLAFVLCLMLLCAQKFKRLLLTITGFTAAHSITLALTATDVLRLSPRPIEAVIALSLLLLCYELAKKGERHQRYRYPVIMAVFFGLFHGMGFASVLNQMDLPQQQISIALIGFNLGVELGQLLFMCAVLLLSFLIAKTIFRGLHSPKPKTDQVEANVEPRAMLIVCWCSFQQLSENPKIRAVVLYSLGALSVFWLLSRVL